MAGGHPIDSIDDAIAAMDAEIADALDRGDRGVLFATVYRAVTAEVRDGISRGDFDDGGRMERFDVLFARRYLDARRAHAEDGSVPESWRIAFEADRRADGIALQHVLLGVNAHINFDLGLAAAEAAPADIDALRHDFERINDVLERLIDRMQDALACVSPWSRIADRVGLRLDETLAGFVLREARAHAWEFATELTACQTSIRSTLVSERDRRIAELGHRIATPAGPLQWAISVARLRETNDLHAVVAALVPSLRA